MPDAVVFFPDGNDFDGSQLLKFHSGLLSQVIAACSCDGGLCELQLCGEQWAGCECGG